MTADQYFNPRVAIALVLGGIVAVALAVAIEVLADRATPVSDGNNAYSVAALGHAAFVALLRELDIPVRVGRADPRGRLQPDDVLIISEPNGAVAFSTARVNDLAFHGRALLVLPKRIGQSDPNSRRGRPWLRATELRPTDEVAGVAQRLLPDARVRRGPTRGAALAIPSGISATLSDPQLVTSSLLEPLIGDASGMLAGRVAMDGGGELIVLADPDLLANHGLDEPGNAQLAIWLIERVRGEGGVVHYDSTIHGHVSEESLLRPLFEFPLILVTLQLFLAVLALIWSASGRFGAARPLAPALARGRAALLETTAGLLRRGRHEGLILRRYADAVATGVARRMHASADLSGPALARFLDGIGQRLGLKVRYQDLADSVTDATTGRRRRDPVALLDLATSLHSWKRDVLNGPR